MFRNRGLPLLLLIGVLIAADLALIDFGAIPVPIERPFQRATCGIGLSSAVSPAWSFFGFDPRTESTCENELWPIPGASCPNPYHGATVVDFPPLDEFACSKRM